MIGSLGVLYLTVCLAVGPTAPGPRDQRQWGRYLSPTLRFSVMYPPWWYHYSETQFGVNILSFPPSQTVHGVILTKSGAGITASLVPDGGRTLDEWIKKDLQDSRPVSRRKIAGVPNQPGGCSELLEVVWLSEMGPGAYLTYTGYYCSIKDKVFSVVLSNWKGNPKQSQLQAIALKIAKSLRTW